MASTKSRTPKKTPMVAKKVLKKRAKKKGVNRPFGTKPAKNKVHVHLVVAVNPDGHFEIYEPSLHESELDVINGANLCMDELPGTAYHHVMIELPIPAKAKLVKSRAKSVRKIAVPEITPDATTDDDLPPYL